MADGAIEGLLHQISCNVSPATTRYRSVFAVPTITIKRTSGVRKKPLATVIGSPMNGTQLSKRLHRPNRPYQVLARSSWRVPAGNHVLDLNLSSPRPRYQFTTAPSVLPRLAKNTSKTTECVPDDIRTARPASDCAGSMVAARNDAVKIPA